MKKTFQDKVAVVTGAGSGIGRELAIQLAARGAKVAISDINEDGLKQTVAMMTGAGHQLYVLDTSSKDAVFAHATDVLKDFGGAHYLFNNAGVALTATTVNMTVEEYEWLLGINMWGPIYGTKAFLPIMLDQDEGHIVNFSSIFGILTVPTQSAYHVSKFAVRGFTECLARELDGTNVSATVVHPGGIATPFAASARLGAHAGQYERDFLEKIGTMLRTPPEDCAHRILKGVQRNKRRIIVGYTAGQVALLARLMPVNYGRVLRLARGI